MTRKEKVLGWRTRKKGTEAQKGQHFPITERNKNVLPRNLRTVSIPPWSELARENRETVRDKIKREVRESVEKITGAKPKEIHVDEEILDALESEGIEELEERGVHLGLDYEITDSDEVELIHTEPTGRKRRRSSSSKDEEFPDALEIKRRERALKRHSKSWNPQ